ncbi:MAG: multidrug effflux MFS transporter [Rhizobiaceae bacterium]
MSNRLFDRTTPPHITTLVIATAVGPLAMNVILPSLPGMARHFGVDYAVMQLAVTLYLCAMAFLQILIGPASDRFGRRPVMVLCFVVFLAATVVALFSPDITTLLLARLFQAVSAAGMVLARAIVRDTVGPTHAASRMGYITMGMALVPMIGPFIGGMLDETFGWQSTFVLTLAYGLVALLVVWLDLGETNHNPSASFASQFRAYPELLRSPSFWGYTGVAAFTSGAFFAFVGGGPYVATEMLGLSPSGYGYYFGIISAGYIIGNYSAGRFSTRAGINRMMLAGAIVAAVGMVFAILLFASGLNHPLSLFGPAFFIGIGNGATLPNANAGMVSVRPHHAGSASGLGGALQIGGGAILAFVAGALLSPETGPYPLLFVMLLSAIGAILAILFVIRVTRA